MSLSNRTKHPLPVPGPLRNVLRTSLSVPRDRDAYMCPSSRSTGQGVDDSVEEAMESNANQEEAEEEEGGDDTKYAGLTLKENSIFFGPIDPPTQPDLAVLFIPKTVLSPSGFLIFNNTPYAKNLCIVLYLLIEAMNVTKIGVLKKTRYINDSNIGGHPRRAIYCEIVRAVDGSEQGYRFFFINRTPYTLADLLLGVLVKNNEDKKDRGGSVRERSIELKSFPHRAVYTPGKMMRFFASAIMNSVTKSGDVISWSKDQETPFTSPYNACYPANIFSFQNSLTMLKPQNVAGNSNLATHPEQKEVRNYLSGMGNILQFPCPQDVFRIPDMYANVHALRNSLPPMLRKDPFDIFLRNLVANGINDSASEAYKKKLYQVMRRTSGDADVQDDVVVDEDVNDRTDHDILFPGVGGSGTRYHHSDEGLAIVQQYNENLPYFQNMLKLRRSATLTEKEYFEAVDQYNTRSLENFTSIFVNDNPLMPDAEQEVINFINKLCSRKSDDGTSNMPVFGDDTIMVPMDHKETDLSLGIEERAMASVMLHIENLGITNGHESFFLQHLVAWSAASYRLDEDNLSVIIAGDHGTSKSHGIKLMRFRTLIEGTAELIGHKTRLADYDEKPQSGLVVLVEELTKGAMCINSGLPSDDFTGDTVVKNANTPLIGMSSVFITPDGRRVKISIQKRNRTASVNATNEDPSKMTKPARDRVILTRAVRVKRYGKTAVGNFETLGQHVHTKHDAIGLRFQVMQAFMYELTWAKDSLALFLPHGIDRSGALAVVQQFRRVLRRNGIDATSTSFLRRIGRVYLVAEKLTMFMTICKVQHEMYNCRNFSMKEFLRRSIRHMAISEMVMRWSLQLCINDFIDPMATTIMKAVSDVLNYSNNPTAGVNGRHTRSVDPMNFDARNWNTTSPSNYSGNRHAGFVSNSSQQRAPSHIPNIQQVAYDQLTPETRYAKNADGTFDYNLLFFEGTWGQLERLVHERLSRNSKVIVSKSQIGEQMRLMREATVTFKPRSGHRREISHAAEMTVPATVVKSEHRGHGVFIYAAYIDKKLDNQSMDISEEVMNLNYVGNTDRVTLSLCNVYSVPFILRRINFKPGPNPYEMISRNPTFSPNPDLSNLSEFAKVLELSQLGITKFDRPVDNEVMINHLLNTGCHMDTLDSMLAFNSFSLVYRQVEARTTMLCLERGIDEEHAEFIARKEADDDIEEGVSRIDQYFPPTYPLVHMESDFINQYTNMRNETGTFDDESRAIFVRNYEQAVKECGMAESALSTQDMIRLAEQTVEDSEQKQREVRQIRMRTKRACSSMLESLYNGKRVKLLDGARSIRDFRASLSATSTPNLLADTDDDDDDDDDDNDDDDDDNDDDDDDDDHRNRQNNFMLNTSTLARQIRTPMLAQSTSHGNDTDDFFVGFTSEYGHEA